MKNNKQKPNQEFLFGKLNYRLLFLSISVVIIGFLLMIGGGNDDPNVFDPDKVYSFRTITLAPIVVLIGYIIGIFAIFAKGKNE